jgi:hypothetical protein
MDELGLIEQEKSRIIDTTKSAFEFFGEIIDPIHKQEISEAISNLDEIIILDSDRNSYNHKDRQIKYKSSGFNFAVAGEEVAHFIHGMVNPKVMDEALEASSKLKSDDQDISDKEYMILYKQWFKNALLIEAIGMLGRMHFAEANQPGFLEDFSEEVEPYIDFQINPHNFLIFRIASNIYLEGDSNNLFKLMMLDYSQLPEFLDNNFVFGRMVVGLLSDFDKRLDMHALEYLEERKRKK